MDKHLHYMKIAYEQAQLAYQKDEVPIGAIIVKDDEVIAASYNLRETNNQATAHAEILVIEEACRKLNSWHLDNCKLYVTLEPCIMCTGAIINSRISEVIYGADDIRWHALEEILSNENINHHPLVIKGIMEDECRMLLKNYFKEKRKRK